MRSSVVLLAIALAAAACSDGRNEVEGVVLDVEGDLVTVESFVVRLADGSDMRFEPDDGVLFHDRLPLSHLREHLLTGEPIVVGYAELDDGRRIATEVTDR